MSHDKAHSAALCAEVKSLSHEGRGIASINGKITFLRGGLPDETVEFVYLKKRSQFDEGQVTRVLQPAAQRTTPICPHFEVCGGCSLQHMRADLQLIMKQKHLLEQLQHQANLEPNQILPALQGPTEGYRYRARLSVKYVKNKGKVLVGFHEVNGRYVADIHTCPILHPRIGYKINALSQLISSLDSYQSIPQIEVAAGDSTIALLLRHLQPLSQTDQAKLEQFAATENFELYLQPQGINSIHRFYPRNTSDHGLLSYTLPDQGVELFFHPSHFTQINPYINRQMVSQALQLLAPTAEEQILDLFCGLGNFSLPLAKRCKTLVGVEGSPQLVNQATANAQHNQIHNAEFYSADLTQDPFSYPFGKKTFDKILLDPPRTGAAECMPWLAQSGARLILYVSCNPATLARDSQYLIAAGYQLTHAGVMDMFPHTAHVESMALFQLCENLQ